MQTMTLLSVNGERCKVESLRNFVFVDNQKMEGSWYAVMSGFMVTAQPCQRKKQKNT